MSYEDFEDESVDLKTVIKKTLGEIAQEGAQANQQQIFMDSLARHGLDEKTFAELAQKDPQGTQKTFQDHVDSYVGSIARRRDPKTGQFLPGKAKPQHRETPSVMGRAGREAQPSGHKRFDPKQSRGTDQDMTNMVLDVLAGDPMFDMD